MYQVLIIQDVLKQYRVPLFTRLHDELATADIQLTVAFARPDKNEQLKQDNCLEPPADFYRLIPVLRFGRMTLHRVSNLRQYDLVIVEQANRHLLNYWLLLRRRFSSRTRLAWWGHGFHHQGQHYGWRDKLKSWLINKADWFFAYTAKVAEHVEQAGMPTGQVSALNNSIDTHEFARQVAALRQTGIQQSGTLLYCGALYEQKRLDLLLDTAERLFEQGILQKLIVLGHGPLAHLMTPRAWLDYRGPCFGKDKARAYSEAALVLNPGLTGLAILDAFAAGLPYITCDLPYHSPEIAYLEPNVNGQLVEPDAQAICDATAALLMDKDRYTQQCHNAYLSSEKYSIEAMVSKFAAGIQACLQTRIRP
ncbi:glycosyltransferase family 4 protein [Bowmanella denitrificans]|uniref:glycosyltransferase family 4 protein n=1 Tax=Bowmanella denitrificans TaxID=366582 RepID=UPI001558DC18|nr:glycosyltransferase family 4 protein [Bowmanella denitrificans]